MKFLCVDCDARMGFEERELPGDGTLAAVFRCPSCGRRTALLTNPMETQLVSSLGVKVGGRSVPERPMEHVRTSVAGGRDGAFGDEPRGAEDQPRAPDTEVRGPVRWSEEASDRLGRVPSFVRGMVRRIYTDWARERGIGEITPEVMDRARTDLGLEGM